MTQHYCYIRMLLSHTNTMQLYIYINVGNGTTVLIYTMRQDLVVDCHHDLELFTTQVERERQERQDRVDWAVDRHHDI